MAPLRTVLIGYGHAGSVFHAPLIAADPDLDLSAVVTGNSARRAEVRRRYPGTKLLSDAAAIRGPGDGTSGCDLAVVATPNDSHAPLAEAALTAGLDVVVDKPFALIAASARRLIRLAEERGRLLTVFHNRRWDADFRAVRDLVAGGRLGEVRRFVSRFERWRPDPEQAWRYTTPRSRGGGIIYDLGAHLIDQALQLFGPVDDVYTEASVVRDAGVPGIDAEDDAFLALRHRSGVYSHLSMSAVAPGEAPRFSVAGTAGGREMWGLDPQEDQLRDGVIADPDGYPAFYRQLVAAVRGEGPVPVDPADAVAVLEIIERAFALTR